MKKKHKNRNLLTKKAHGNKNVSKSIQRSHAPADLLSRATVLCQAGNLNDAEKICRSLLASYPKSSDVLNLLGIIHNQRGDLEESIRVLGKAITIDPNYAEAYNNRGVALHKLKRYNDAMANYDKATAINPDYADVYNNRGLTFYDLKRYSDAMVNYDKAIAINPNFDLAYNNRGLTFYDLKRYSDAMVNYDKAIAINPNYVEAYNNRGMVLQQQLGHYNEAMANYDKAIAINPNYANAYWSKSLLKILLGEYEEGWRLYEWRWKRSDIGKHELRTFQKPLWLGEESLAGKTILLHAEQGFGDTIQFCRYVRIVESLGAKIILEVQKPLVELLATLGGSGVLGPKGAEFPEFDFHCPLMSLPRALKTTLNNIPVFIPYLAANPKNLKAWQKRLGVKSKPRIGLAWSGAAIHKNDHNRSIPLSQLAPLLQFDFEFHSIQTEVRPQDAEFLAASKIISHEGNLHDFLDTASLVSEMDIIISVDTSVVHLAGALGKPVWVLLPFAPDFRWLLDREDSPWYPTARLFRQPAIGDWDSVIARVKTALAIFASNFEMPSERHNASEPIQQKLVPADLLSRAMALHQSGNLNEAEIIYNTLLASNSEHVVVLNFLGTLYCQRGNLEEGIRLMEKAIAIKPDYAEPYYNRGQALQMLNRHKDALESYEKAIVIDSDYAEAYNNRGLALHHLGRYSDAIASYEKAIAINPNHAGAYYNRGITFYDLKQYGNAIASYDEAIAINPNYTEVYNNRGITFHDLKQYCDALADYEKAIAINPNHAGTYYNRGITFHDLKQYSDALADYEKAIAINPNYTEAYNNRGLTFHDLKQYSNAMASYEKAITINPNYAEAYNNRGRTFHDLKQYSNAMASYEKAITINPNYAEAYWNKSFLELLLGEYREGWKLYEWRWKISNCSERRKITQPLWLGEESLAGKTILLSAEQGLGDTIQFCRYARMVESLGAKIILEVQKPLIGLLGTLGGLFNIVAQGSKLPEFDFYCPLLSLPLALKTTLNNIPATVPYLSTSQENLQIWKKRLGAKSRPRIGLAWSGAVIHKNDHNRSIPLRYLAPLLQFDFEYHSIQTEVRPQDADFLAKSKIISHRENLQDFLDTASLVSEMDIIISVDTSVVHLAGALGKPVRVLLPFAPDFRWLLEREDSPWYPTARLFRQPAIGDWDSVTAKVKEELVALQKNKISF